MLAVAADLADGDDRARIVPEVERELGPVDALVSNAGINLREDTAWDADPDDWWRVFQVNVLGAYLCARAVLPAMVERGGGRIVTMASGAAYLPGLRTTAYPASTRATLRSSSLPSATVLDGSSRWRAAAPP